MLQITATTSMLFLHKVAAPKLEVKDGFKELCDLEQVRKQGKYMVKSEQSGITESTLTDKTDWQ